MLHLGSDFAEESRSNIVFNIDVQSCWVDCRLACRMLHRQESHDGLDLCIVSRIGHGFAFGSQPRCRQPSCILILLQFKIHPSNQFFRKAHFQNLFTVSNRSHISDMPSADGISSLIWYLFWLKLTSGVTSQPLRLTCRTGSMPRAAASEVL